MPYPANPLPVLDLNNDDQFLDELVKLLPLMTPEQLVGAYMLANLGRAGLEVAWDYIDGEMAKRGLPRPEMPRS